MSAAELGCWSIGFVVLLSPDLVLVLVLVPTLSLHARKAAFKRPDPGEPDSEPDKNSITHSLIQQPRPPNSQTLNISALPAPLPLAPPNLPQTPTSPSLPTYLPSSAGPHPTTHHHRPYVLLPCRTLPFQAIPPYPCSGSVASASAWMLRLRAAAAAGLDQAGRQAGRRQHHDRARARAVCVCREIVWWGPNG
ncbi:hypothetical protein IWX90DRAFT_4975 [Phyllosticta citrichinensis]|uniref:Uncharacterized protein n=1 Tax=Phyllosticta citrichinensis TaxID=1130410 RepID=A0ABR1Y6B6_9PEZI